MGISGYILDEIYGISGHFVVSKMGISGISQETTSKNNLSVNFSRDYFTDNN